MLRSKQQSEKKSSAARSILQNLALPQHAEDAQISDDTLSQVTPRQSNLSKHCQPLVDLVILPVSSGGEEATISRTLYTGEDIEDTASNSSNGRLFSFNDGEEDDDNNIFQDSMVIRLDNNVSEPDGSHGYTA